MRPTVGRRLIDLAEFDVRIADDLRKATVFLGEEIADDKGASAIDPSATGFFIAWRSDSGNPGPIEGMKPECTGLYLITARHVAQPLGAYFAIRFNKKGGKSDIELVEEAKWHYHPDDTVDVAVLHRGYPDWADCIPVAGLMLKKPTPDSFGQIGAWAKADDPVVTTTEFGVGDIAYVVGLFHFLHGKEVNLPVVHTGHIALLPEDEKIPVTNRLTGKTDEVEGYLVEAHGLEGLSGAPVFVRSSKSVTAKYSYHGPPLQGGVKPEYPVYGRLHSWTSLLGLWQGSWDGEPSAALAKDKNIKGRRVPVGMGIVVPAYKIAETLNSPELVLARQREYQRRIDESADTTAHSIDEQWADSEQREHH